MNITPVRTSFNFSVHALALALLTTSLIACGGGNSHSINSSTSSAVDSLKVTCTPNSVADRGTSQCNAVVSGTGSYSSAVTWSSSSGAITSSGLFTAPTDADTVIITATSTQDPSVVGTTSVAVLAPLSSVTSVSVAGDPPTLTAGATSQCNATVSGMGNYSSAVTWSSSSGTITSSGLFTAPATVASVTITATSIQDTAVMGSTAVTIEASPSRSAHIVLVMEENQSYNTVVGNAAEWPNLNQLIATGALPTSDYANTHPSIGNYFMLTTGQILTNDDSSTRVWGVDNLARRMLAAHTSFRIYAEGITQGYTGGDTGLYVIRHNPFAMLSDLADDPQVAHQHIWPFSQFAIDLANGTLPSFSYIVPNVDDDAHSATPLQADTWLQTNLVQPLASTSAFAAGGDGLLIVNFDEAATSDARNGGGHIAPVFWGPLAKSGYRQRTTTLYQQQSLLRTIMDLLGLSNPPGAAVSAPPMTEFLASQP